jgi:hypothetical protein
MVTEYDEDALEREWPAEVDPLHTAIGPLVEFVIEATKTEVALGAPTGAHSTRPAPEFYRAADEVARCDRPRHRQAPR